MVSQGAMSQPGRGRWRLVHKMHAGATHSRAMLHVAATRYGKRGGPSSLPLDSASRKYGLELFADHAIDGATPGAAEEDRCIQDRQQQRELPAAARAREEISVACVPGGYDLHLHGED